MEGFTPSFLLQVLVAIGSAGAVYGAIRADLNNMARSLDQEREERKQHEKDDDKTHHELREGLQAGALKQAVLEGRQTMAAEILEASKGKS